MSDALYKSCEWFICNVPESSVANQLAALSQFAEKNKIDADVYGKGQFLNEFENEIATLLGYEAGAFFPSGTMAQLAALRIWCDLAKNNRFGMHASSHLELHEHHAYKHT